MPQESTTIGELVEALNQTPAPPEPSLPAVETSEPASTQPNDAELLEFYRYKEKVRHDIMRADPFLPVKEVLGSGQLEPLEQAAMLEKIQEIAKKSDIKDPKQLASFTQNYAIPDYLANKERMQKEGDLSEAQNFKWALTNYGEYGRKALEEFRGFAREQWGDGTPEYMRHDLFKSRFPAFIEKQFGTSASENIRDKTREENIKWLSSFSNSIDAA